MSLVLSLVLAQAFNLNANTQPVFRAPDGGWAVREYDVNMAMESTAIAKGRFPASIPLATTIKVWRLSDIYRWMDAVSSDSWKPLPDEENPPENVRPLLCQVSK